jgi:polar amino acid transport system substrate-binding protein
MKFSKVLKSTVLTLTLAGILSCTRKADEAGSSATAGDGKPATEKVLLVGTDAAYAPFETETANKELTGFDIDLLKAVAEKAQLKVKFMNTPWEGLFTQLESGDRDILVSAITINEERKKQMDFSDPYFEAVQLIAVPSSSKVKTFADLKGLKVGVQTGTTGDDIVSKLLGKTNANIKRFEGTPLAIQELQNGGVEAVVGGNGVVYHIIFKQQIKLKNYFR